MTKSVIRGFSKFAKHDKIHLIEKETGLENLAIFFKSFDHAQMQEVLDGFSENVLSNYYLPFSIAPNFLINGKIYHVPMVTEESSVVAAASSAAGFWALHGGFKVKVLSTIKTGQVHFKWTGPTKILTDTYAEIERFLLSESATITRNMEKRGGGIIQISLEDYTLKMPDYYRLNISFNTVDSMGANFINTVLEQMGSSLKTFLSEKYSNEGNCEVIMAILSNYTPDCLVECSVEAPVGVFDKMDDQISGHEFVEKFSVAVEIANIDIHRAVTHNKGIMNGVDAVVIATGNDFRAVESDVHSFASRNGSYSSLSSVFIKDDIFHFSITLPLAIGTVGGLTALHPMAKKSLEILGNPNSKELMAIIASVGMANHFSAIKALVTSGIQRGHMKMHLGNILSQLGATKEQHTKAFIWFADKIVSVAAVREFINSH